ncbi:unnamed protein product [Kluyveromyces dobzhanskii CBS 2104]|uniref:DNA repair and recombination protein RDH54 n=1 Tax=Kluyveromyces dobzhanskii CBS 2104 TaxID=1427455 RepID=A0A0A8LC93_9SACH|nr:unnamed protein product [Kluyveromyces dobzhanskii CBS 2104]
MKHYVNKPFKPPRMVGRSANDTLTTNKNENTRLLSSKPPTNTSHNSTSTEKKASVGTKSSIPVDNVPNSGRSSVAHLFTANYRRVTNKKNKTWDGDGYANRISDDKLKFYNEAGISVGSTQIKSGDLYETIWRIGSTEFQIDYEINDQDELASVQEICNISRKSSSSTSKPLVLKKQKLSVETETATSTYIPRVTTKFKPLIQQSNSKPMAPALSHQREPQHAIKSALPPLSQEVISQISYSSLFDPGSISQPLIMNKSKDFKVDVIVDPLLSKTLRPHQREGVKFLYDCVMGLDHKKGNDSIILEKDSDIRGCLLADEMGLGKTLMTITLLWTLLKQTPNPTLVNQRGVSLVGSISKAMIVCPVTLIGNWKKEFKKWLPMNKIGVLTLHSRNSTTEDKAQVKNFLKVPRTYQILIVGYEKLLSIQGELQNNKDKLDLLVCDEGHRLKNKHSKVLKVLQSLDIDKKIILSGTPIQNDLEELYTIIDFINPGILGSSERFKKEYILPITRSRDVNAKMNGRIVDQGRAKSDELIEMTKRCILRRTNELLHQYLPPKTDLIIFCKPTIEQIDAFQNILSQSGLNFASMTFNSSLGLITAFKKICNSTRLISSDPYCEGKLSQLRTTGYSDKGISGKLRVLLSLLHELRSRTEEKVVIISNYTQTLDIIEGHCCSEGYTFSRLDGSTATKNRDQIVTSFNNDKSIFVFLLSAKSGGVGLNLIGASRLVLFDNDWNPSIDLQAMSRIHRDGQIKPCYIYRLVTTGCIDEKILQRQLMKIALSKKFLDSGNDQSKNDDDLFQQEELKDLFTINTSTLSNTHDLICSCSGEAEEIEEVEPGMDELTEKTNDGVSSPSSSPLASSWISALDAQKLIEQSEDMQKGSKTDLMKKCLIGYKHINPKKTEDLIDEIMSNVFWEIRDCITYAFVKDAS